jgi:AraC-like DNA-binding protein
MIYRQIKPHPQLKDLIRCYWTITGHTDALFEHRVISDYCMDIITDLKSGESIVAGPAYGHYDVTYCGDVSIFGIRFYPGAFFTLFGIPASEFYGLCIPLESAGINFSPVNSPAATDKYLLKMVADRQIDQFSASLNSGALSFIREYSKKTVNRRMAERAGLTYGAYSQILGVHKSISLMLSGGYTQADIAVLSGFYDQSHFIHTFKRHTGSAPLTFINEIKSSPVRFIQYPLGMY